MRGETRSYLIEADDGLAYVVKHANNPQGGRRVLVNEFIGSILLAQLGVATPDRALVDIDSDFVSNIGPLPTGLHFGSRYPGDPGRTAVYDFLPDALLPQVVNLEDFRAVLVFDKWTANADGRQDSSEVCRVSGKVDAVRLPKEAYFAERVMQSEKPDIHIIGHWTYPANTTKTMNVIANNVDSVEFFVNGASRGKVTQPENGYLYAFPNIAFTPGAIKAVGYKGGVAVAQHELKTAGAPAAIKLTLHTAPGGFRADGQDVALIDFEVVDANGERCPTDDARVDFTWNSVGRTVSATGPAVWRGGYNSGRPNSTNNLYLNTECGINRVAMRSTLMPGTITLTAKREGLKPATITFDSKPVPMMDGLTKEMPLTLSPVERVPMDRK